MRIPRVRVTVRWMMLAVACIAIFIVAWGWGSKMLRRRAIFLAHAKANADVVRCFERGALAFPRDDPSDVLYQVRMPQFEHFQRLEAKYRRAAARPWISVEPDPPDPW